MTPPPSSKKVVYRQRQRCPNCPSVDVEVYSTKTSKANARVRQYSRCRACGWRFVVVVLE